LVLIQQRELTLDAIQEGFITLDMAQEEAMVAIEKLLDRFRTEKDYKSCEKLGKEIEMIEIEYTEVQNRAQGVYDELNKSNAYSKFVRTLGETQPTYQHVTETHQTQVSQPSAKVTQHNLVSNKSDICLVIDQCTSQNSFERIM